VLEAKRLPNSVDMSCHRNTDFQKPAAAQPLGSDFGQHNSDSRTVDAADSSKHPELFPLAAESRAVLCLPEEQRYYYWDRHDATSRSTAALA